MTPLITPDLKACFSRLFINYPKKQLKTASILHTIFMQTAHTVIRIGTANAIKTTHNKHFRKFIFPPIKSCIILSIALLLQYQGLQKPVEVRIFRGLCLFLIFTRGYPTEHGFPEHQREQTCCINPRHRADSSHRKSFGVPASPLSLVV